MNKLIKFGVLFASVGIAIPLLIHGYYGKYVNWNPLKQELTELSFEREFRVNYTSRYVASVDFHRNGIPMAELHCLTGTEGFSPKQTCRSTPSVLRFSWEISDGDGKVVSSGRYDGHGGRGGETYDDIDVSFAHFYASRGQRLKLRMSFDDFSHSRLSMTRPVVWVSASDWFEFSLLLRQVVVPLVLWILVPIGSILIALGWVRRRRLAHLSL